MCVQIQYFELTDMSGIGRFPDLFFVDSLEHAHSRPGVRRISQLNAKLDAVLRKSKQCSYNVLYNALFGWSSWPVADTPLRVGNSESVVCCVY